jgi:glutamate-1-semialdehyde 2,1-aminomutase
VFQHTGKTLAAVICDPFACAAGLIPAQAGFLERLRTLCTQHGVVLIFDEVITGFRVAVGGAQAHYGVTPDLATFAKALGGGLAVAAVAGKADLMKLYGDLRVVHAGTYNANALAMAGTVAALGMLTREGGAELEKAHVQGRRLWRGLEEIAAELGLPMQVRGVGSVFSTSFVPADAPPVVDFRSSLVADADSLKAFWRDIHYRGVQFTGFGIWFMSTAHTSEDIEQTLEAAAASLGGLRAD